MSVQRSRQNDAWKCGWRSHVRRTASEGRGASWLRRRCKPYLLPGTEVERKHTAADLWMIAVPIGKGEISLVAVCRAAPLDAAQRTALSNARLPEQLAMTVGIERIHDAGFLRQQ